MADNELSESELKELVNSLTSNCCQVLEKSLLKLHKHFEIPEHFRLSERHEIWDEFSEDFKVKEFYKIGGLTNILQLLSKPNAKWMEKAIHILTICCHVTECREFISNAETISLITSLFKIYYKNEIIQVCLCDIIYTCYYNGEREAPTIFHNLDISSAIIDSLLYYKLSDSDYGFEDATTTLDYLNIAQPEEIIQIILTNFNPTNNDLTINILRILAAFRFVLLHCNPTSAQQILTTIGTANLVNYTQSSDKNLQRASVTILTRISDIYVIGEEIGEAGMVPIYINLIQKFLYDDEMSPLYGLCELLQHVDNRGRLFQTLNGFETLISLLRRWDEIGRMQSVIMCAILKLLSLDLVSILIHILDNYVITKTTHESVTIVHDYRHVNNARIIIRILTVISSKHKFQFRFLNSAILDVLLRAWLSGSYDRQFKETENIVMALVRSDVCFEDLILLQFPQMVRKIIDDSALLHSVDSCFACEHVQFCKRFILREFERKVHSEYGLENINRLLTTGSESVKRTVALILLYILATEVERCNQVSGVNYLALELFLKNLADPSNDNFQVSLNIFFEICEKGQSLNTDSFSHEMHKRDYCVFDGKQFDKDVHFILDDGERISANRSILIQSSDMFDAMLNGHFMEANQSEIHFKCASAEIFKLILHFLYGCTDSGETSCPVLRNAHYEFLFEASNMADRMVLMNLKSFILRVIVKKLTRSSALSVQQNNYTTFLSLVIDHLVKFLFKASDMADRMVLMNLKNFILHIVKKLTRCPALSVCRYAQQNNYTTFLSLVVDHLVKSSVGKDYKTELFTKILSSDLNEHLIGEIKLKIESVKQLCFLRSAAT